jgi:hypothetical protein
MPIGTSILLVITMTLSAEKPLLGKGKQSSRQYMTRHSGRHARPLKVFVFEQGAAVDRLRVRSVPGFKDLRWRRY